jgi:hypothetical protein
MGANTKATGAWASAVDSRSPTMALAAATEVYFVILPTRSSSYSFWSTIRGGSGARHFAGTLATTARSRT